MNSKMAWIFAGIFGGFILIVLVKVFFFPAHSSPTALTLGPYKLEKLGPTKPITLVLPAMPSGAGNAGEDYHRALQLLQQTGSRVEAVLRRIGDVIDKKYTLSAEEMKLLTDIEAAIAAGAAKAKMEYTFRFTPQKIELPYLAPEAEQLRKLAEICIALFFQYTALGPEHYAQAEKAAFEVLTLGYHMMEERARFDTVIDGVGLQVQACELLQQLYGADRWNRPDRYRNVKSYLEGLDRMRFIYRNLQKEVIWAGKEMPGDVFNLVEHHADRAVRTEAIIRLGVIKLTTPKRGDRKYALKLIARKLRSPDAIERAAAQAAKALDTEGLRRLYSWQGG